MPAPKRACSALCSPANCSGGRGRSGALSAAGAISVSRPSGGCDTAAPSPLRRQNPPARDRRGTGRPVRHAAAPVVHCTIMPRASSVSRITRTEMARRSAPGRRRATQVFQRVGARQRRFPGDLEALGEFTVSALGGAEHDVHDRAGRNALQGHEPCAQLRIRPVFAAFGTRHQLFPEPRDRRAGSRHADHRSGCFINTVWFRRAFKRNTIRKKRRPKRRKIAHVIAQSGTNG